MTDYWRRVWIFERKGKKKRTYVLRWYGDDGKVKSQATGTDKRLAERMRQEHEQALNNGTLKRPKRVSLKEFAEEHIHLLAKQRSDRTVEDYQTTLQRFIAFAGEGMLLHRMTHHLAEKFFAYRLKTVSPATANKDIRALKAIFNRAKKRGCLETNPFAEIELARVPEKDIRVLTADEVEALIEACPDEKWKALVFTALTTGMRRGELVHLTWDDVALDEGLVRIRCKDGHRTKSGRNRVVALMPAAANLLRRLKMSQRGNYVFVTTAGTKMLNNLTRGFKGIVERAGIPQCTVHDLRRTFVSHLAMAGVSEAVAQQLAGHAFISTTLKHYTRILPEAVKAAPRHLPYASSPAIVTLSSRGRISGEQSKTA